MRDLATKILDLMGNPVDAEFGALPDRPTEIWEMRCDATKARERLGYDPKTSLEDGLSKTIEWYREELSRSGTPFVLGS
jgi:nucleoside-diphosphate-sugar epimerase